MEESAIRFFAGGAVVTLFAVLGDVLRPRGFAGLFAAAPSVACASLALAVIANGAPYAALEARSMMIGEIALVLYALACVCLLRGGRIKAGVAAGAALLPWALSAAVLYWGLKAH